MDEQEIDLYNNLFKYIRQQSREVLEKMTSISWIDTDELPINALKADHWVSVIEVNLEVLSVHLKVHFDSATARLLASKNLELPEDKLPVFMLRSFIQEFLNYLMGAIKSGYSRNSSLPSVPLTEPSYDTVNINNLSNEINVKKWCLKIQGLLEHSITIQAYIRVTGELSEIKSVDVGKFKKVVLFRRRGRND